jgi:hypothetical protein
VRLIKAGAWSAVPRCVSSWVLWQLNLHADVAPETGGLLPWRQGPLYEQPAREVFAQRAIRSAWADLRAKEAKRKKR